MVKELLKKLFITEETSYFGFPYLNHLLPEKLVSLYGDYYIRGSGSLLFVLIFGIAIYQAVVTKGVEQKIARFFLLLISFAYVSKPVQIINTTFFINPFGLPILNFPPVLFYLIAIPISALLVISFRNQLFTQVRPSVIRLFDFCLLILLICSALPLYSGELWK